MRRKQLISLLIMSMILFPILPYIPFSDTISQPNAIADTGLENSPDTLSSNILEAPSNPQSHTSPSESFLLETPVETPDIPDYQTGSGSPRLTQLTWNVSRSFFNRNSVTDYSVHITKGMLYHDVSFFSRIGDITSHKDYILVEDHDPLAGWTYYWPMEQKTWPGEVTFMAFNISSLSPVELTEFAIYLYSPFPPNPLTGGLFNYTVYAAAPSIESGLGTMPDLAKQIGPWMQELVPDMPRGDEQWVSLPTVPIVLDSDMTYADTFYFALNMMPGAAACWVLMEDVGIPPDGDGEDEGDAWNSYPWPGLDFISGPSIDFFLVVAFTRFFYPSEIGMIVNGTPVMNIFPTPGTGIWDGGWHSPAINMTNANRYYNVTYAMSGLTYDVDWLGWFYENLYADSHFTAYAFQDWVDWNVSFYADFPTLSIDRRISVAIGSDWNVNAVLLNGLAHMDWYYQYSPVTGWWIIIDNAARGQWTILCDSPDYMVNSEVLDMSGQVITQATGFDTVTARGYVQDQSGQNATNGYGYVIVYDPRDALNTFNFSILQMPPGGVADINWSIWWTSTWAGVYTLHILWSNGTEVGLNFQTLEVYMQSNLIITYEFPQAGEPVIKGDIVHIEVYFENQYGFPIYDAEVTVINDSSGEEWGIGPGDSTIDYEWINWAEQGFEGYYTAFLFTDNASINILHNITMQLSSPFNQDQNVTKQFEVKIRTTHIVFFWNGQPLPGLNNISDYWFTSPHPYINDSSLQFTIRYTDDFGLPITGAQLTPYIVHESQGVYKRLDWIELYVMDSTKPGFYNITIDTNPIAGKAFHEGDSAYIVIYASKFGYQSTWSDAIDVQPQPRPTFIDVPTEFLHIVLYEDWQYPTLEHPTILRVILRDALNGEDLSHGIVKAGVNGGENTTLTLATPGLGLYEIPSFDTGILTPGTYSVNIYAEARDFVATITAITLTVLPKQTIDYHFETNLHLIQSPPNHNIEWWLNLQLFLENTSSSLVSYSSGKLSSQPGMTYLAPGTEVTLMITAESGNYDPITGIVGTEGWVFFEGLLTAEGEHHFYISLEGTENHAAVSNMEITPTSDPLYVMSFTSMLAQNIVTILIIAAIVIIVPLGSGLAYRRYVLIPKRRQKLAKYQAIADTFSDVANLNRLLVLHKESGICVFDPFAAESQDATLVAGFLQAISTFGHDLGDSPGLAENSDDARTLRELQYEGFRILINDGQFVRVALVLNGVPSEQLRGRLETFTNVFETRYSADFKHWEGRVDQFNSASDLVEEVFLISLRHPHSVVPRKPKGAQLSSIESDIYKLSKELTKDREYIFLGQILSTYLAAAKTDKLEALMTIYQLRMKGIFKPIQLAPVPPPDVSAG
ncbi:MAG: hypothetical protein ACFFDU_01580 [Candidatus Thorarchaeota archaeon]